MWGGGEMWGERGVDSNIPESDSAVSGRSSG